MVEKTLVLDIALQTKSFLEKVGYKVKMTRDKDIEVPLLERTKIAQKENADIFVSIHANSSGGSPIPQGIESYYTNNAKITFNNNSKDFAYGNFDAQQEEENLINVINYQKSYMSYKLSKIIQSALMFFTNKKNDLKIVDRGIKTENFLVLISSPVPATLVEVGFITNSREAHLLGNQNYRKLVAYSIAQGIRKYFE
ncbi:MAG: N-acetylmuramoyl-L-alanine amidase [candidate division TM6 bacterium GW2011_GWE2_31_21]|nr:MAG: N-acetylmuramoyl-L-alanine amidase [candidate division TM6 bacterium GW2011_GWE2_31_21]KKP53559.1 MAG: N-acetylmuramoyl-L-alanine amidase [candidate division TM6 bacterium GW2011_GWF2_33_332]